MSDNPWNPEVERIRKAMMERFSDKLSMEEISEFAYSVAGESRAPAPQPCEDKKKWMEEVKADPGHQLFGRPLSYIRALICEAEAATPPELELEQESDGRWLAEFLRFTGVMAYGKSPEEAIRNAAKVLIESEPQVTPKVCFGYPGCEGDSTGLNPCPLCPERRSMGTSEQASPTPDEKAAKLAKLKQSYDCGNLGWSEAMQLYWTWHSSPGTTKGTK